MRRAHDQAVFRLAQVSGVREPRWRRAVGDIGGMECASTAIAAGAAPVAVFAARGHVSLPELVSCDSVVYDTRHFVAVCMNVS